MRKFTQFIGWLIAYQIGRASRAEQVSESPPQEIVVESLRAPPVRMVTIERADGDSVSMEWATPPSKTAQAALTFLTSPRFRA